MWTNLRPNKELLIFPQQRIKDDGWTINVLNDWIKPWVSAKKDGHFIFWYDGKTVSDEQLERTKNSFEMLQQELEIHSAKIELKDINNLKLVKEEQEFFNQVPLYAKVDLLRIAAGLEYLETCASDECAYVYVDVDKGLTKENGIIKPLDLGEEAIFTEQNMFRLKKFGLIMNDQKGNPENNFLIIGNNPDMKKALADVVLSQNINYFKDWMNNEIEPLLMNIKSASLRKTPLDKRWPDHPDFKNEDRQLLKQLRSKVPTGVQKVYSTMVRGPLMKKFNELMPDNKIKIIPKIPMGGSSTFSMSGGWPEL